MQVHSFGIDVGDPSLPEEPCPGERNLSRPLHTKRAQPIVIRSTLPVTWDATPCFHPSFPATI